MTSLSQIITPYPITITGGNLFYNSTGPNSVQVNNDGIYISCQPTGSSSEETQVTYNNKNPVSLNINSILNNPIFIKIIQILTGCIVFILIFLILNYGYNFLTSTPQKLPTIKMPRFSSS